MDGVFMYKILKRLMICGLFAALCWSAILLADRRTISEELIRFHVVANSDSREDQSMKLLVRDAVLDSLRKDLQKIADVEQARTYLQDNLPKIRSVAIRTLESLGFDGGAEVSLCRETFDVRHYDTFSLPSGIYHSLRIVIGEGKGHNWWCVAFPTLCIPATVSGFESTAVSAGFSESLTDTLSGKDGCEIRFFLLDQLGRLEKIFFVE